MPSRHFGEYGVYSPGNSPNPSKPKLFRPLPHERCCPCQRCDNIRAENHLARTACNFRPITYPPRFYESVDWSEYPYE